MPLSGVMEENMQAETNILSKLDFLGLNDLMDNDVAIFQNAKKFVEMQQLYNAAIKELYTKLEILNEEFQVKYDYNPIHHIETRLKSAKSILDKLEKRDLPLSFESIQENIFDIAGIRVICNYIDDIYKIEDFLSRQDDVKIIRVRDYIKDPKENGYRSLHLILQIKIYLYDRIELMPVEIQIRTIAMDFWASLEHHLKYKAKNEVPQYLRDRLTNCSEVITNLDEEMQLIHKEINKFY